jgi:cell division protein FtsB
MSVAHVTDQIDEIGKPAWLALLVLSFILFWPLGLALFVFLKWSGRMGCHRRYDRHEVKEHFKARMREAKSRWHYAPSSGNRAFDEYREEALKKLEEEQREFREFLDRLRHAKDKSEFDEFMAERARRPQGPEPQPEA